MHAYLGGLWEWVCKKGEGQQKINMLHKRGGSGEFKHSLPLFVPAHPPLNDGRSLCKSLSGFITWEAWEMRGRGGGDELTMFWSELYLQLIHCIFLFEGQMGYFFSLEVKWPYNAGQGWKLLGWGEGGGRAGTFMVHSKSFTPHTQHANTPHWSPSICHSITWENFINNHDKFQRVIICKILLTSVIVLMLILYGEVRCRSVARANNLVMWLQYYF